MINKHDHIHRVTAADETITDVIRKALADNFERIPFTHEGGFIATDLRELLDVPAPLTQNENVNELELNF